MKNALHVQQYGKGNSWAKAKLHYLRLKLSEFFIGTTSLREINQNLLYALIEY